MSFLMPATAVLQMLTEDNHNNTYHLTDLLEPFFKMWLLLPLHANQLIWLPLRI